MADGISVRNAATPRLRKANECFIDPKHYRPPEKFFDAFWNEGELAMLFGAPGTGVSILGMQLAELIARGRTIEGFEMSERRHKVLYVDLNHSQRQFDTRYRSGDKPYRFSENLYRSKPPRGEKLIDWLYKTIDEHNIRVVILDDLTAVRKTYDGTRETLKLMRELKELKEEKDISILALAGSREAKPGAMVCEGDMMRSQVLCDAADSVFAIGLCPSPAFRYLIQTRSQDIAIKWDGPNVPVCFIERSDEGFLAFSFEECYIDETNKETQQLICDIKRRRNAKATFRSIADELGISKTKAQRLCKKWTPALEKALIADRVSDTETPGHSDVANSVEKEEQEECDVEKPEWLDHENVPSANARGSDTRGDNTAIASRVNWQSMPFLAALKRIHIHELKRVFDRSGKEMFVEKEQHHDGKPIRWYEYDAKGKVTRKDRDGWGITIKHLDSPWVQIDYLDLVEMGLRN